MKARILYVDPSSKKIKLSLQPELLDLTLRRLPAVGQTFEVLHSKHNGCGWLVVDVLQIASWSGTFMAINKVVWAWFGAMAAHEGAVLHIAMILLAAVQW